MTTLKTRSDLFTDHNVPIVYASAVDTRRYNAFFTLKPYLYGMSLNIMGVGVNKQSSS